MTPSLVWIAPASTPITDHPSSRVSDSLAPESVQPRLRGRFGREVSVYLPECESTQRVLPEDAPEGALAITDEQLAGRGRLGRSWVAPPGTSILCSLVLRPQIAAERLPELMPLAAAACADAITAVTGLAAAVKHPNDVLVGGRKVAGVLAEAREGRVVLGIGINVSQSHGELPERVEHPATSLLLETGHDFDRAELLIVLLDHLEHAYDAWVRDAG